MVLRLEAEELTQYTDDLDADQKRELLAALLHSLDSVLPFLQKASLHLIEIIPQCIRLVQPVVGQLRCLK